MARAAIESRPKANVGGDTVARLRSPPVPKSKQVAEKLLLGCREGYSRSSPRPHQLHRAAYAWIQTAGEQLRGMFVK